MSFRKFILGTAESRRYLNGKNVPFRRSGDPGGLSAGLGVMFLIIGLTVAFLVLGLVAPTGLGSVANATTGNAMKNVDAGSKTLFSSLNIFFIIAILIGVVTSAFAIRHVRK